MRLLPPQVRASVRALAVFCVCLLLGSVPIRAQAPPGAPAVPPPAVPSSAATVLTLDEALDLAELKSEQLAIAQFGVARASADERRARSERMPQVAASASYDRTLKSEFSGVFSGSSSPVCDPFTLRPSQSLDARVAELERAIDCGAVGGSGFGGGDFADLPFGQANTYRLGVSVSQPIYAGGRIAAQMLAARIGRTLAEQGVTAARALLLLEMTQSFYDAALADRLVAIAEATETQAVATLAQIELRRQAGRAAEFEVLRARVARDNQAPAVIRAKAARTLAYLRLKQVLEIPASQPVTVLADLDDATLAPPRRLADALAAVTGQAAARTAGRRVPVQQAASNVALRETSLGIVRSQRKPSVFANSAFGKVAYAGVPGFDDWRTNWTVGATVSIPLFTGGRIKAEEMAAGANLGEARAQQKLVIELAEADTEAALALLDAARATWSASAGTVEQARRAYDIADIRYREGISTQLELLDARLLLEQAQVNRAQAARDLQVARARVALLPDLPLGAASTASAGGQ